MDRVQARKGRQTATIQAPLIILERVSGTGIRKRGWTSYERNQTVPRVGSNRIESLFCSLLRPSLAFLLLFFGWRIHVSPFGGGDALQAPLHLLAAIRSKSWTRSAALVTIDPIYLTATRRRQRRRLRGNRFPPSRARSFARVGQGNAVAARRHSIRGVSVFDGV